jgi:hypothetical protein
MRIMAGARWTRHPMTRAADRAYARQLALFAKL